MLDLRQLHPHENSGHEEAQQHTHKSNEEQQEAVEFRNIWRIGTVQNDEAETAHSEEEAGRQTLHDVLPVDPETQTR